MAWAPVMSPASVIEVGLADAFPTTFINYIRSLPSLDTSNKENYDTLNSTGPSSKRRKLDSSPVPNVCVARSEILLSRQSANGYQEDFSQWHHDIGSFLYFSTKNGKLRISARSTSPLGKIDISFSLRPQDMSGKVNQILDISQNRRRRDVPGAIWTSLDLRLDQCAGVVSLKISLELFWNETSSPYAHLRNSKERKITHVPSKNDEKLQSINIPGLEATLFPYQKRSLQWLLSREGVAWVSSPPGIRPVPDNERTLDLNTFRIIRDVDGHAVHLSDVFQTITKDTTAYHQLGRTFRGGILAEEMGLGKTLEIIGLMLLHKRSSTPLSNFPPGHDSLVPSGATLIVTPPSLRHQWISELSRHAPGMRVKDYTGRKSLKEQDDKTIVNDLAGYDVVITTYNVLSAELHFAIAPPDRSRRHERVYHRKSSPLVEISWWRVCLDEAQMIENGISQAAALAQRIPRMNAWGITGTPVKDDVKDLRGLLSFLRYEPYCSLTEIWQALTTRHKPLFKQLFNSISLRHTKAQVRDEISLPPQKRFVISMPFTAVEEQHYLTIFKEMAEACDLSTEGAPLIDEWNPENYEDVMRLWLNRLRQTTLHPEVGVYGRRVLGNNKEKPMRTVEEVLNAMLEQSETAIRTDERVYLSNQLSLGQLFENSPRVKEALAIWEKVRDETKNLVSDAKNKLQEAVREQGGNQKYQRAINDNPEADEASDSDTESVGEFESKGQVGDRQNRFRDALELYHKAIFFCANAYFQIRESESMTQPDSEEYLELKKLEDQGYEDAKMIRRQILRESHQKATRLMIQVSQKANEQSFAEVPELVVGGERGIETGRIIDNLETLCGDLNTQANVIDMWREQAIQLLLQPLIDEEESIETTGEELADSTRVQDELMVYVQALRAVIVDRHEALSGQANELVRHETETSMRLARNGDGPAPDKLLELFHFRAEARPTNAQVSMRGIISEFRSLKLTLSREPREGEEERPPRGVLEAKIAGDMLKNTQQLLKEQTEAAVALESEIEGFKRVMNARLEYYRQLQAVSDSVLPYEGPKTEVAITRAKKAVDDVHRRLLSAQAKYRYLLNLKETGSKSNEPRMCVICQTPFTIGVLTVCGHQFCKECMMMWFKAHRNCPVCKKVLKADNLHDIVINSQALQVRIEGSNQLAEEAGDGQLQKRETQSPNARIYTEFNAEKLEEMKNIELDGPSFTTKVDTLVRHLLWLRESDPGAKSIVFSQYKDFLDILRNAFARFRIGFASIDDANGITKFKEDPAIECFLLHARAHSSGLNLVNASHVFLCEPLLNTALELQAIARVDRIGQQHETTVWLYIVSGTVEESIYNLSVHRRMEHMGRNLKSKAKESEPELLDANIEAANTLEMEHAALSKLMSKDRSAGEMVDRNDLWECLFGHVAGQEVEAGGV
ncbi:putative ATP-dependent helicase [Cladobotryum mycophilum]|uniref:ATP-dependent helicase n=1 Tax=Cladobotryum mycophilum TaxID=491253 RepID=A0ABR0SM58_9HYPO